MCAKEFSDSKQFLVNYRIFQKSPQISHIHKNVIFRVYWNFLDQLLLHYKFQDSNMTGIHFFNSSSYETLIAPSILITIFCLKSPTKSQFQITNFALSSHQIVFYYAVAINVLNPQLRL